MRELPMKRPYVNPKIPIETIDWRLSRLVGLSDAQMLAKIQDAEPMFESLPVPIQKQIVRYSLWRHHMNQSQPQV